MMLVGVRIPSEYLFDLSKQIAGLPCLYFRIYESGIYVGKSFGKNGPYERHKAHMDGCQCISRVGRGRLKEIVVVWDETRTLTEEELNALEAAYIQHFPWSLGAISRTNGNTMQIVYGEGVREVYLWSAYITIQRILTKLAVLHEPIEQVFYWREIALPAAKGPKPPPFNYLTDVTGVPDTVVIYAPSEQLSRFAKDLYWPAVKLPNERHRRIRFIAFCCDSGYCYAEIESKHFVGENKSSKIYDLKLKQPLFTIPDQYAILLNSSARSRRRYVLLEKVFMGHGGYRRISHLYLSTTQT